MKCQLTEYGYPDDPYMDSGTRMGMGAWNNHLTLQGCALNKLAAAGIGVKPLDWLRIVLAPGVEMLRQYQDVAPETDHARCDCYEPAGFIVNRPDYAEVTKYVPAGD